MTESEEELDEELLEFATDVAEALEQCLDVDDVRVENDGALIVVIMADGGKYRLRIREEE